LVLLDQDLAVPFDDHVGVALEQPICSHCEVSVAPDCVGVVVYCAHQVPVLNVQVFESVTFLHFVKLIRDDFLEADSFVVEERDKHIIVTTVTQSVVACTSLFVDVQVLLHVLGWGPDFNGQEKRYVFEVEIGSDVHGCAAKVVLMAQ